MRRGPSHRVLRTHRRPPSLSRGRAVCARFWPSTTIPVRLCFGPVDAPCRLIEHKPLLQIRALLFSAVQDLCSLLAITQCTLTHSSRQMKGWTVGHNRRPEPLSLSCVRTRFNLSNTGPRPKPCSGTIFYLSRLNLVLEKNIFQILLFRL